MVPELTGLAGYLVRDQLLTYTVAAHALSITQAKNTSFTQYLVKNNILTSEKIILSCAKHFKLPIYDLNQLPPDHLRKPLLSLELIKRYRVIPISRKQQMLQLGVSDPTDRIALESIEFQTGSTLQLFLIAENALDTLLENLDKDFSLETQIESTLAKMTPVREPESQLNTTQQDEEPVTIFVDRIFQDALSKAVSDIHIEPYENYCRIRFRCDGMLNEVANVPSHLATRVVTRLKIMANLNIAERRLPQDGRIHYQSDNKIDVRINTCPTLYGEKIVLRILKNKNTQISLETLGFLPAQEILFKKILALPQGLILVTGPTGSGKTITLYAALNHLNETEKNISSIEDPVEIELAGINQISINAKIGLDFATALRTLLRQDPDIIMLGEMRDAEAANIALQAAQTGHLVLSTLHTNSAIESLARLQSIGIPTYQLTHAITLIISQRLIRKLCQHCKQLMSDGTYQQNGCEHCYHGYVGRTGLFEAIVMTDNIQEQMLSGTPSNIMLKTLMQQGHQSLWQIGMQKVRAGITSQTELIRVVQQDSLNLALD